MKQILQLMWLGFWQGVGVEVSFLGLWIGWHGFYGKTAHRLDPGHLLHKIHDYFIS